jgi:hypothetical protein
MQLPWRHLAEKDAQLKLIAACNKQLQENEAKEDYKARTTNAGKSPWVPGKDSNHIENLLSNQLLFNGIGL